MQQKKTVTILAVDDVPDNLFIIESILGGEEGHELTCVSNGQSALEYVSQQPPDLILLDVMMPDMDGYEVTKRIRQNKDIPYIPILLVTAHDQSSLSAGLDSGADDFIRKPFDIDELMARVRSLLRLKHSLDEQTAMIRQRDDFVARLTHDLRTPLVAANRMLHLSLQGVFGEPPEEMSEAIGSVITNNESLLQLTNTLLQVYRHEAGQKKLAKTPLSIYMLSREVVKELKPLADEKSVALTIEAESTSDTPENSSCYRVEGDHIELRRLLTNLLGNAIKFTDSGSITVKVSTETATDLSTKEGDNPSPNYSASEHHTERLKKEQSTKQQNSPEFVNIAIIDTGPGIAPEAQEKIFEWFYQGDHMRAGSGLGLHLSKRIAELHRGNLTLNSEVGKGSTFTLSLPRLT